MSCLQVTAPAAMRVWRGLSARLGLRLRRPLCRRAVAGGLGRLRKEVRACEYGDVHVMWDMLGREPSGTSSAAAATWQARTTGRRKSVSVVVVAAWSRLAFYCCGF